MTYDEWLVETIRSADTTKSPGQHIFDCLFLARPDLAGVVLGSDHLDPTEDPLNIPVTLRFAHVNW